MKIEPPSAYQLPELNNNINLKSTLSAITKTAPSDFGSISGLFVKVQFENSNNLIIFIRF